MRRFTIFRKFLTPLLLAATLFTISTVAQDAELDALKARVDGVFAQWDKPDSPGCALGVVKDGAFVYKRGYGQANLDYGIPISSKTSFYIASTSKQFTAASIALLVREGKISLDDDIRKYVPEIPQYQSPIIIRHLIHHTSGLRDYLELTMIAGKRTEDVNTDEDFVRLIARQKSLNFKPGERYLYSNSGYLLLSQIVKKATGKSLRVYADENLFKPLGMVNTFFHDDRSQVIKNRATGYVPRAGGGFSVVMTNFDRVGDGGLYTSVDDLLLWDRNFYDNKLPGGADFITSLLMPGTLNSGEKIDYAFALIPSEYKGLNTIAHGGGFNGFRAELIRFPEQKFSVACICNLGNINAGGLATRVADIFLEKQLKQPVTAGRAARIEPVFVTLSEQELNNVAGLYFNPTTETAWRIAVKDGKLWFVRSPTNSSELKAVSPSVFRMVDPQKVEITFAPLSPAKANKMQITVNDGKPDIYESKTPAVYIAEDRGKFAGAYYSEELEAKYVFSVKDAKLVVKIGANEITLGELFPDVFTSPQGQFIKFRRDGNNRITGFVLSSSRAKELPFSRM